MKVLNFCSGTRVTPSDTHFEGLLSYEVGVVKTKIYQNNPNHKHFMLCLLSKADYDSKLTVGLPVIIRI
jgi:hypothetical protein